MQKNISIVAAALRVGELILSVPKPGRHHHVLYAAEKAGFPPGYYHQGFVTSEGQFVERIEARKIAEVANQLIACESADGVPFVRQHPELFSEDVW
jgi:hypothetical protein